MSDPGVPRRDVYPVSFDTDRQEQYSRFLPLVKWLLVIPHLVAITFLLIATTVVTAIAFFATLITGRYPRGMWEFMTGVHRWTHRVMAYNLLITDRYPPFTLKERETDTVRLTAVYPDRVARWRPLFSWLLIAPYAVVASILFVVAQVCSFAAVFTILFTRRVPGPMFELIHNALNWQNRASSYALWMSTEYPPYRWSDE